MAKKKNWLSSALILSVLLNLAFFGLFLYLAFGPHQVSIFFSPATKSGTVTASPTLRSSCLTLQKRPYHELVSLIRSNESLEMGYQVRDIALAFLVRDHFFDLERALAFEKFEKRKLLFSPDEVVVLFPGLKEGHYQSIVSFLQKELYPLTVEGVFKKLQKEGVQDNLPLVLTFIQSEPFLLAQTLFSRSDPPVKKGAILALLLSGKWDHLARFSEKQKKESDFSQTARQALLLSYLRDKSKVAASLLLLLEAEYAEKQLLDPDVVTLLQLLDTKSDVSMAFAKAIVSSPRQEAVVQLASSLLARFEPIRQQKKLRPHFRDSPPAAPAPNVHVVGPGESLWTIAHRYQTSIKELIHHNGLQQTVIQPGQTLQIPPPGHTPPDERGGIY